MRTCNQCHEDFKPNSGHLKCQKCRDSNRKSPESTPLKTCRHCSKEFRSASAHIDCQSCRSTKQRKKCECGKWMHWRSKSCEKCYKSKLVERASGPERVCNQCCVSKLAENFQKDSGRHGGLRLSCKQCVSEIRSQRRIENPMLVEVDKIKSRQWRLNNPEKSKASVRNATLKKKYGGFGIQQYNEMLERQGGGCAICSSKTVRLSNKKRNYPNLHVDHNHASGKIRGLLCQPCNTTLGKMKDDPKLLRKAAEYLELKGNL